MDHVDMRLLGLLLQGVSRINREPEVRGVYGRAARQLALDEETVRRRVGRLESAGIISGWQLLVNPNVLGLRKFGILMTVNPQLRIDEAVRKIKLVQGITSISRPLGDILRIGVLCESQEVFNKRVELISELTGTREFTTYAVTHPRTEVELTSNDWKIISALRPDPLVHYTEVAKKLGLSSRTVSRRLTKLSRGNVIFFRPNIDFSLFDGCSCVSLFVFYTAAKFNDDVEKSIFAEFEGYVLRAGWGSANHGYFEFAIPKVHIAQEIADWTRNLEGVRQLRLLFRDRKLSFYDEAVDQLIAGRVKMTSTKSA